MQPTTRRVVTMVAAIALVVALPLLRTSAEETTALHNQLINDASDGELDDFSLLDASLIASGVDDRSRLNGYVAEFYQQLGDIDLSTTPADQRLERAEELYEWLHEQVLTGRYYSTCTEVDRAFDDGDYNCVTVTVLYQHICRQFDLDPIAVATRTHVRSRFVGERPFDVETTCRDWFDVVRRKPDALTLRLNQSTRTLSDVELLAKIYYNRGVSLLERKSFADAIQLLETSQLLDPTDQPTKDNLAAGINNWALDECNAGRYERAVELVERGIKRHPDFEPLLANDVHIHQRWATKLLKQQRFADAMATLATAYNRRPDVPLFDLGRVAILGQWSATLLEQGEFDRVEHLLQEASTWCDDASTISDCKAAAVQQAADTLRQLRP